MEVIVESHGSDEQAQGWYYYLEDKIEFPFNARCTGESKISLIQFGENVQVVGFFLENNCLNGMFVEIEWSGR